MSNWTHVIKPYHKWYEINLREAWRYRDLLWLFVHRDFVAFYKQTILGPLWFLIEPLATTAMYTLLFAGAGGFSTDGSPKILFYLSGVTMWQYFADCLIKTSAIFTVNANIFGKVYFPRIILPCSVVISNMIKLGIQFVLFVGIWCFYLITQDDFTPNYTFIALVPVLIIIMAIQGLAFGMIVSALTTKYRDLQKAVTFGIRLVMFASPVLFPLSTVGGTLKQLILLNPMTSVIETFRYGFLGTGTLDWSLLAYSLTVGVVALFIGIVMFNKVEKSFMDTV